MSQPFKHSAESLLSFFSQAGRGFYVPYYQRSYSWDDENAKKLISDIINGTKRVLLKPNNSIFLGTLILHDEKNVSVGIHSDTPNLLTKVSNVVDGQQRITSIGLLACTLSYIVSYMIGKLNTSTSSISEFTSLAQELSNQLPDIQELFSVEIRKTGAQPKVKPLIIRAGDTSSNPASDQWTLAGIGASFYESNTAKFLSDFIDGVPFDAIDKDERIGCVIDAFINEIKNELNNADLTLAQNLLHANNTPDGTLHNFMDYPPDMVNIRSLPSDEQLIFCQALLLLAICSFLKNACHFVVIECSDESMAFDMFQSLNATGTPLTAFEVFKPVIVKEYGANYSVSIKPEVDRIERVFEKENTASGKEDLTDKVIGASALTYNGSNISARFSEERDWLLDNFPTPISAKSKTFISCIANQAEYRDNVIRPRKSPKNSVSFTLVSHLQSLGLTHDQADMAALCIFYLKDAGHQLAHSVLSTFYAKLIEARGNTSVQQSAALEFTSVCQATAAFFTLWMGGLQGRFPDQVYKKLFQATQNISVESGKQNQTDVFVKNAFRRALEEQGIYDNTNISQAKILWVDKAKDLPWYLKKSVCRFALFVASNDAAPDLTINREGLFIQGMQNSATMLNCKSWYSTDYEVIEHVATRDKPSNIKFSNHFDQRIYPGNKSIVDKIGNLTLLSTRINSSVYSEWPDKVFYYWGLTMPQSTVQGPIGSTLQSSLGITSLPPSLSTFTASSNYLPHLAPLAYRGIQGLKWDMDFIDQRSEHLCQRIFDSLDIWLK